MYINLKEEPPRPPGSYSSAARTVQGPMAPSRSIRNPLEIDAILWNPLKILGVNLDVLNPFAPESTQVFSTCSCARNTSLGWILQNWEAQDCCESQLLRLEFDQNESRTELFSSFSGHLLCMASRALEPIAFTPECTLKNV